MTRKTVTLTEEDNKKLALLVKRTKSDASKVMRAALRRLYAQQVSESMEEAYREYYGARDPESEEIAGDFGGASETLW